MSRVSLQLFDIDESESHNLKHYVSDIDHHPSLLYIHKGLNTEILIVGSLAITISLGERSTANSLATKSLTMKCQTTKMWLQKVRLKTINWQKVGQSEAPERKSYCQSSSGKKFYEKGNNGIRLSFSGKISKSKKLVKKHISKLSLLKPQCFQLHLTALEARKLGFQDEQERYIEN